MMLQFRRAMSGSSRDTRPLNRVWTSGLFSSEWNIVSEGEHLLHDSHFNQIIAVGAKQAGLKEHGMTTQSPASDDIVVSLRETQKSPRQCSRNAPGKSIGNNEVQILTKESHTCTIKQQPTLNCFRQQDHENVVMLKNKILPESAGLHVTKESKDTQMRTNMFGFEQSVRLLQHNKPLAVKIQSPKKKEEGNSQAVIMSYRRIVARYCEFRQHLRQGCESPTAFISRDYEVRFINYKAELQIAA